VYDNIAKYGMPKQDWALPDKKLLHMKEVI
jgi:hypothetical protein